MTWDLYLRGPDREAVDAALETAGLVVDNVRADGVHLSRIGPIVRPAGFDGEEPLFETIPDYHANLRLDREPSEAEIEALAGVSIPAPATPFRVWA